VIYFLQSSRHILRSNEIIIPPNGLLDVELDLSFSMQVNFSILKCSYTYLCNGCTSICLYDVEVDLLVNYILYLILM